MTLNLSSWVYRRWLHINLGLLKLKVTRFFTNEQTSKIVTNRGKHNALYPAFDLCNLWAIISRRYRRFSQIDLAFDLRYLCDISSRGSRRFSQIDPAFDLRYLCYLCDISSRGLRRFSQIDPAFDLRNLCYLREFGFIPTQRRKALRCAPWLCHTEPNPLTSWQ